MRDHAAMICVERRKRALSLSPSHSLESLQFLKANCRSHRTSKVKLRDIFKGPQAPKKHESRTGSSSWAEKCRKTWLREGPDR